ncbi:MAG TPA: 3-methyl-2-oxobutanoate hydroxymethyltransferase [Deltaproteobacteria bacterium]|nr:MAG: 3-methyl-2-oxobutanoate hydroxymethyltransferase [Deltaproteobacteria bacterium GWA2_55_82]OGQ62311.1 MAG: 3-methyl-2-oxobutanoate hydroxymethyltransferase [Deltaproteobacteria bacterium RIFCSPLOWO2_02_FULL_55_12]OIJ74423.1 MAG: 3-methyl-2-oxobutanoate hydroxymethyltransferase [Deltaproteobacteria bacterium GWC2_55_46]HBG47075.1 3-methyl-2-oxobutanoate hydroxymethyltransferase [Deltaproteobacteria bacterium]HCY10866.1 3-methyl-2-oxobutanoate hydroxymethyltransferase [Deltaproteobacteria
MKKITAAEIVKMKEEGRKVPVLTAYDFATARVLDEAGVPVLLVGDSAGMVEAGYETTLPVTVDEIIYHTRAVVRGRVNALVVSDMPFGSYQTSTDDARRNAARMVKEGGAEAVKLEGGRRTAGAIRAIVDMDVPVMGHVGLTPQSVHRMGGYRVQGRTKTEAELIIEDALAIEEAGAFSIVLEGIPASLAKEITGRLSIPTIGIGAGAHCDGQVLVVNDMLGLTSGQRVPKFVKRYADLRNLIFLAATEYIKDVAEGTFPSKEHSY